MLKILFQSLFSGRRESLEQAARSAEAADDLRGAVEARRALVKLDPRAPDVWLALAKALHKAGEEREAIAAYHEALQRGAPAGGVHLQLGVLHMTLAEYPRAEEHFKKVLAAEPSHADALCMLGIVMNDLGRFDEAVKLFERTLEQKPAFSEAHFNLGLARFERSDFQGASRSFTRCVELKRGKPWGRDRAAPLRHDSAPRFEPIDMAVNGTKLRHDC